MLCTLAVSCKTKPKEKHDILGSWSVDFESNETPYKKKGNAHSGQFYGYCDKISPYTSAITYQLPDSIKNCYIRICFELYAKIVKRRYGQSIVIAIQNKDSILYWNTTNVNSYTFSKNKWVLVCDSVQFYHQNPFPVGTEIRVFGLNAYEKAELNVDDIKVKIKKITFTN